MNANRSMTLIGAAVVIAAAGSSGTAIAGIDGSGIIEGAKVAKGKVSRFGSIYVNGVRYDTDTALFLIDGALGSEADLAVGQIVSVLGTVNDDGRTGTAYLVSFEDAVDGPISAIDVGANRVTVMGQTVVIDQDTMFELSGANAGIESLGINDIVEVSGYVDSQGRIVAASIRHGSGSGEYDLSGTIESVDTDAMRLTINGLTVDFGTAGLFGLDAGLPQAGDAVEIVGDSYDEFGVFVASRIYAGNAGLAAISGAEAEFEGVIGGFHSLNEFDLGGTRVRLTWNTRYVNDWVFGLSADRKIQVEGSLDDAGILVADTIVFEKPATETVTGRVDAIAGDYLVVGSRLVQAMPETIYRDDSDSDERRFGIGSVRIGDRVEVRGYGSADLLRATMLKRVDDEPWNDDEEWNDDDEWDNDEDDDNSDDD